MNYEPVSKFSCRTVELGSETKPQGPLMTGREERDWERLIENLLRILLAQCLSWERECQTFAIMGGGG